MPQKYQSCRQESSIGLEVLPEVSTSDIMNRPGFLGELRG